MHVPNLTLVAEGSITSETLGIARHDSVKEEGEGATATARNLIRLSSRKPFTYRMLPSVSLCEMEELPLSKSILPPESRYRIWAKEQPKMLIA